MTMFRFTIRELVLLTLVVAMGVGWWIDHRTLAPDAELHRRLRERAGMAYREQMRRIDEYWSQKSSPSQTVSPDEH
jgi:hypothetical protein